MAAAVAAAAAEEPPPPPPPPPLGSRGTCSTRLRQGPGAERCSSRRAHSSQERLRGRWCPRLPARGPRPAGGRAGPSMRAASGPRETLRALVLTLPAGSRV
ncbi:WAS/WASL-interacting protein family member 3-like isoform X2 [Saccopteryx bilineata]